MKKLFYSMFALAALAMTNTSCSDDLENNEINANEVEVTFNVQLEKATGSRAAIGDGTTATELQYAVYKADGNGIGTIIQALSKETTVNPDLTANVTFRLVKGQTYNFMFWAQKPGVSNTDDIANNDYYTVDKTNGKISINYKANNAANNEGRDAFYAVEKTLKVTGPINKTITLKRPFAQINVGTALGSLKDAATADVKITKTSMTIKKAANELDLYTGKVSASDKAEDVTYTLANIPELTEAPADDVAGLKNVKIGDNTKDYEYLAMNYILVDDHNQVGGIEDGSHNASVNVDFTVYDENDKQINKFEVPNVTVQRNWRTNIIGDILNDNVTFNVVIDPKFDNDHNYKADEELAYVLKNGGEYTVNGDIKIKEPLTVNGTSVILNLSEGSSISIDPSVTEPTDAIVIEGNGSLTINGTGVIKGTYDAIWAKDNAKVIINGGNYTGGAECIYARDAAKVVINGGTFQTTTEDQTNFANPQYAVLNLKNNGKDGCDIEVFGGTFMKFDPSNNVSENPAKDFVAKGYKSEPIGTTGNYIVVPETSTVVSDATGLQNLTDGATVVLAQDIPLTNALTINKNVTIKGGSFSGKPVYVAATANVVFDGVTFNNANSGKESSLYLANYAGNVTINNCTFEGFKWEAVQITPVDGSKITVTNNTFVAPATEAQRYLHIQADKTNGTNATIVVTGNSFGSVSTLKNSAIDIDYVKAFNQITAGNNKFEDAATALTGGQIYICNLSAVYDNTKAYNAFVATENKPLE